MQKISDLIWISRIIKKKKFSKNASDALIRAN